MVNYMAENTDGKGFIKSLQDENVEMKGKKVMMLGAGRAGRAIAVELANAGAETILIANRPGSGRGEELVKLVNEKTSANAKYFAGIIPWMFRKMWIFL